MKRKDQVPVPPDAFLDLLPVEALYIAPGEYEMVSESGQRLFYVEGSALAEWLRDRINNAPLPRSRSKKQKVVDAERLSDLTAQLADRHDIEYGHHETLPRGTPLTKQWIRCALGRRRRDKMKIDRQDASIELTRAEADALTGKTEATPAMLADNHHPAGGYKTFAEKVEHRASELHYETDRTVLIHVDDQDDHIATCDDRGLKFEAQEGK